MSPIESKWAISCHRTLPRHPARLPPDQQVNAFADRLKSVAGFKYVAEPMPMRISTNAVVYYLFFASQNRVGAKIVGQIMDKYRDRRG